jgi:two-component system, NarL family, invasion response regulator UvrY
LINILIADNHTLVRKGVRALLAQQPGLNVVAEAETYEEALEQLRKHSVEVVLLDVSLPVPASARDGLDLISEIRSLQPLARTLVLTMHTESEYAMRALRAGVNGYVTKDVTPELLISAIRRVAGGAMFLSPSIAESLALRVALQNDDEPLHKRLSRRELAVFGMLADGKTINEIAQRLTLSAKTVSAHKLSVLRKLNMRNVAELVRYAIEHQHPLS